MDLQSGRLGPIERAIQRRDKEALFEALMKRTVIDPVTHCWDWRGSRTPQSYGTVGRSPRVRYVHRLAVWASGGFRGDLADLGPVHHVACARRSCWRPGHVIEVTALLNVLDASLRKTIRARFQAYETVITEIAPGHEILSRFTPLDETPGLWPADRFDSAPAARRRSAAADRLAKVRQENRMFRFGQVAEVLRLREGGMTRAEALAVVAIDRRVFERWLPDYLAHIEVPDADAAASTDEAPEDPSPAEAP